MIQIKKLTKTFGTKTAVNQVSFEVQKGEVLGFLGPNGAGKSTTIRMIAGYLPSTEGEILIDGVNIHEDPIAAKAKIGYMPETNPLYKEMTAREFLRFTAEIRELDDIENKIEDVLKTANLVEVGDQLIETLSKGYRSRLSFAAAIIHNPPILLLDEPTDGLDPNQKNEIRQLIKALSKEKAIIVSTHILEEVEAMCSRIAVISEGRLVLDGTPADFRKHCETADRVVVSFSPDRFEKAKSALAANLAELATPHQGPRRYRVEKDMSLEDVGKTLQQANVDFEEIYHFDAPLDEAFRKLTKTME